MMNYLSSVVEGLKGVVNVPVYLDNKPESQDLTCICVTNLGFSTSRNDVNGSKTGKVGNWRITVVSKINTELESTINQIESLDNKSISGFQKVFVDYTRLEPKGYSEPFRRAFITIRTYV